MLLLLLLFIQANYNLLSPPTLSNIECGICCIVENIERGIAVDVVSRLVYYTDDDAVFAMKIDGGRPFSLIKSGRPRRALVLDPPRG